MASEHITETQYTCHKAVQSQKMLKAFKLLIRTFKMLFALIHCHSNAGSVLFFNKSGRFEKELPW